jgi:aspartate aminotransferase
MFLQAKRLERNGKKIIHLEIGEPDFLPSSRIKLALVRAFESGKVHYTEPSGIPILKKELAKKYRQFEAQVIITPGARFAVYSAIVSLVNPGEEIIIFEPAWPAYRQCAEFIGAKVKAIRTSLTNDWNPPMEQLEKFISDNTKMMVVNYPNNPTGKIIEENTFKKIVDLARKNNIIILSDEVYSEYSYKKVRSVLEYGYDKAILISSWSKSHAMTGFRIGYGISNKDIIGKMEKIQATAITSVAEPIQYAALCALKNKVTGNVNTIKRRMDIVRSRLDSMAVRYYRPDGGMYYFIQLDSDKIKTFSFIRELLEKGVCVAPGIGFGLNYEDFIRISVCQPVAALNKGLNIINSLIRKA